MPRTIWSLSNAFTSAFKELDPIRQFKATANLGEFLETRSHSHSCHQPCRLGEGIGLNRVRLATSKERDGGGDVDHPWAVNVVHNLPDFLAAHLHTNDRV